MDIKHIDTVCVAGWQKTGISLAKLLLALGKKVKVTESKKPECFSASLIKQFKDKGVSFEFGGHSKRFISGSDLVLLSPGIDFFESSLCEIIQGVRMPYTGEIEFASHFTQAKIIAITGTNGKTTTAYLTYLLLKKKKRKVYLGGNIGRPFSEIVLEAKKNDLIVLEVSSFQLESIVRFRPHVAVLLNVGPDHIDRHKSFDNYFKTKMKIFQSQKKDDWALASKSNVLFKNLSKSLKAKIVYFGGDFSDENLDCVYRIGRIFGIGKLDCLSLFSQPHSLPHRRQNIRVLNGVKFINDSKATNPSSTAYALKQLRVPVILIAGGRDKGLDYSLISSFPQVKKINLFGEASLAIQKYLDKKVKCQKFETLKEAVFSAHKEAARGDVVLFSPMCASFDMFSDYRQRGNEFTRIVKSIS